MMKLRTALTLGFLLSHSSDAIVDVAAQTEQSKSSNGPTDQGDGQAAGQGRNERGGCGTSR